MPEPVAPVEVVAPPVVTEVVEPETPGADALGDPGKKALNTMKDERNAARAAERDFRDQLAALQAKVDGKAVEYEAEQKTRKVESDALAKANERILKSEIRAAATGKLSDPKDALKFLDLAAFEVGVDGEVDAPAVLAALEALIKDKPYLAAQGGKSEVVFESPGSHRTGAADQLTSSDLDRMSPQQIEKARSEGRFDRLFSGK